MSLVEVHSSGQRCDALTGHGTHDETAGLQTGSIPEVAPPAEDNNDNDVGPLAVFATIVPANGTTPGVDPDMPGPGYATGTAAIVTPSGGSFGADGPGATPTNYALQVVNGTFSGVSTTSGTQIFLYNGIGPNAGLILGRIGTEAGAVDTANATGDVAFALSINPTTGVVSMVQYVSLLHPTITDYDESIPLAANAVQVQVTFTDGDNDPASALIDVGTQIRFAQRARVVQSWNCGVEGDRLNHPLCSIQLLPKRSLRSEEIAIWLPSGLNVGSRSYAGWLVNRV